MGEAVAEVILEGAKRGSWTITTDPWMYAVSMRDTLLDLGGVWITGIWIPV